MPAAWIEQVVTAKILVNEVLSFAAFDTAQIRDHAPVLVRTTIDLGYSGNVAPLRPSWDRDAIMRMVRKGRQPTRLFDALKERMGGCFSHRQSTVPTSYRFLRGNQRRFVSELPMKSLRKKQQYLRASRTWLKKGGTS